jgi:hypothetical protein
MAMRLAVPLGYRNHARDMLFDQVAVRSGCRGLLSLSNSLGDSREVRGPATTTLPPVAKINDVDG